MENFELKLLNAKEQNQLHPDTFHYPSYTELHGVAPNEYIEVGLLIKDDILLHAQELAAQDVAGERVIIRVLLNLRDQPGEEQYIGEVVSDTTLDQYHGLHRGDVVSVHYTSVLNIMAF